MLPQSDAIEVNRSDGWCLHPDGSASLVGTNGKWRFRIAGRRTRVHLSLFVCGPAPSGCLTIVIGGSSTKYLLRLPQRITIDLEAKLYSELGDINVNFSFEPSCDEDLGPRISHVLLSLASTAAQAEGTIAPAWLCHGQVIDFTESSSRSYLSSGWGDHAAEGVQNSDCESTIVFRSSPSYGVRNVELSVAPILPVNPNFQHILAISSDGAVLAVIELKERTKIAIALPPSAGSECYSTFTFHSFLRGSSDGPRVYGDPLLASFLLLNMTLDVSEISQTTVLGPSISSFPTLACALGDLVRLFQEETENETRIGSARLRERIAIFLAGSTDDKLERHLRSSIVVFAFGWLRKVTSGYPRTIIEHEILESINSLPRLIAFTISYIFERGFSSSIDARLSQVPEVYLQDVEGVVEYVTRGPNCVRSDFDADAWITYLEIQAADIRDILALEGVGTSRGGAAARAVEKMDILQAIFSERNLRRLAKLRSECFELLLSVKGYQLELQHSAGVARDRIRLGVLVRNFLPTPEGWNLLGTYRALDKSKYETFLLMMDGRNCPDELHRVFEHVNDIGQLNPGQAVSNIRSMELDIFVIGAFWTGFENLSIIVTHQLAPVQINFAPAVPLTLGLRSFNFAICVQSAEPVDAQDHYTEKVVWMDSVPQSFFLCRDAFPSPMSERGLRERFALDDVNIVFASGAMQYKIGNKLIKAWARTLAKVDQSVIILYPFAANWLQEFQRASFKNWIYSKFEEEGVDSCRVHVVDQVSVDQVSGILSSADIYLDSFPYAGATTVVEALLHRLPIVVKPSQTQRGLWSTAWLREFGLDSCIAITEEDYVDIAVRLAFNSDERQRVSSAIMHVLIKENSRVLDSSAYGAALHTAFSAAIQLQRTR